MIAATQTHTGCYKLSEVLAILCLYLTVIKERRHWYYSKFLRERRCLSTMAILHSVKDQIKDLQCNSMAIHDYYTQLLAHSTHTEE